MTADTTGGPERRPYRKLAEREIHMCVTRLSRQKKKRRPHRTKFFPACRTLFCGTERWLLILGAYASMSDVQPFVTFARNQSTPLGSSVQPFVLEASQKFRKLCPMTRRCRFQQRAATGQPPRLLPNGESTFIFPAAARVVGRNVAQVH